ncbi:hypothetical protein WKY82_10520 [Gordonia malaquae]|uniref:hypothetical protein n=1 Tax=Gordonia TaxID=2053 RepID=UPI0030C788D2
MIKTKHCWAGLGAAGGAAVSVGAGIVWSPGISLIVAGVQAIAAAVLFYDPTGTR